MKITIKKIVSKYKIFKTDYSTISIIWPNNSPTRSSNYSNLVFFMSGKLSL